MKFEKRHIALAINYGKYIFGLILCAYLVGLYKENEWRRIPLKNNQMEPKISSSTGGSKDGLSGILLNPLSEATNNPAVDDIVRFEWTRANFKERDVQEVLFLGRVIALPGSRVKITKGDVFVDGTRLQEDYIKDKQKTDNYEEIIVPKGHVYLLVDNRNVSKSRPGHYLRDSRQLGMIPIYLITGVVKSN